MRIQKLLSKLGVASRRSIEKSIENKEIKVNGKAPNCIKYCEKYVKKALSKNKLNRICRLFTLPCKGNCFKSWQVLVFLSFNWNY